LERTHEQIVYREIEAAHAPATLPFLMNLALLRNKPLCDRSRLKFARQRHTISEELWRKGVRDAAGLGKQIVRDKGKRIYTFAVDLPFSTEYFSFANGCAKAA